MTLMKLAGRTVSSTGFSSWSIRFAVRTPPLEKWRPVAPSSPPASLADVVTLTLSPGSRSWGSGPAGCRALSGSAAFVCPPPKCARRSAHVHAQELWWHPACNAPFPSSTMYAAPSWWPHIGEVFKTHRWPAPSRLLQGSGPVASRPCSWMNACTSNGGPLVGELRFDPASSGPAVFASSCNATRCTICNGFGTRDNRDIRCGRSSVGWPLQARVPYSRRIRPALPTVRSTSTRLLSNRRARASRQRRTIPPSSAGRSIRYNRWTPLPESTKTGSGHPSPFR